MTTPPPTKETKCTAVPVNALAYPFPIRPGVTVSLLNIPADMTKAEAERIAAFIKALAVPEGAS